MDRSVRYCPTWLRLVRSEPNCKRRDDYVYSAASEFIWNIGDDYGNFSCGFKREH